MLKVTGLNVFYGESHLLRDIELTVSQGEMVCLIGRHGVGKTSLMKSIIGLLKSRSGQIFYGDQSLIDDSPDQRARLGIGYVPQGRGIIPRLTVKENLLLGLESCPDRVRKATDFDLVFELFPVLKGMLKRFGGELGGGQQQQLAIGRALMAQPRLLLLDEPTEGIEVSVVLEIEAAIRQIIEKLGVSVLLVEQHLLLVRKANWFYAMEKGTMVASGATSELSEEIIERFLAV